MCHNLLIWLNSFRIWYYKDWFKEIHSFKCTCLTWLLAWTTCFGTSWPLHLLLRFPGTVFISSLTTWMNTVQHPALSSKVLSRKALWLPDRPRLPGTSSRGPSCPSPSSVSFSDSFPWRLCMVCDPWGTPRCTLRPGTELVSTSPY